MQTKVIVNILKGQSPEMDWPLLAKRGRSIVGYSDYDVHGYIVGYSDYDVFLESDRGSQVDRCKNEFKHVQLNSNVIRPRSVHLFRGAREALCDLISRPILDLCFFKKPMSPQDT
jgi:hypothetical protein